MKKLAKAVTLSLASFLTLSFVGCATVSSKSSSAFGVNSSNNTAVTEVITNYTALNAPAANTNILIIPDKKNSVIYNSVKANLQAKGYAIVEAPLAENTLVTVLTYSVSPVADNALSVVINLAGVEAVGMVFRVNKEWKPFSSYTVRGS